MLGPSLRMRKKIRVPPWVFGQVWYLIVTISDLCTFTYFNKVLVTLRERSGSVVECLTRDRGAAGSSLTGVTALWSLGKTQLS